MTERGGTGQRHDRRAVRHEVVRQEIIAAAWTLVRVHGLSGLAMRELGERVGMRAQSIYSYFPSKHTIFDAMFSEGYSLFGAVMEEVRSNADSSDAREYARVMSQNYFEFCVEDPVRFQLLFLRTIPDFVPSTESYAIAVDVYRSMTKDLTRIGVNDPQAADLLTALLTGLVSQQIANDPGGNRWRTLVDRSVEMFLGEYAPHLVVAKTRRK